ncbi:C-type cyclin [Drechmeria coniospora]|uniref:RNA polymerase II holoenzyme cyclin-like subunit n=1 Tax=Drechmeria coniospora TaxID=98403 RepID=A0A151GW38_DRECN|nr:C-type cyclin [Drechmeria coniospora]KYK61314.1 C-type cyclin [Drechmeria coniospora]ODA81078.1 hypothetical protein RJ55_04041 [Drechmeria coniospora]
MASSTSTAEALVANGAAPPRVGPHPGFISSSNQYSSEIKLRRMLKDNGCDPAREDNYCLQGVQLIENVRDHLQLPVRTFDTACTYFHKFRLNFRDAEYNYQDAALASLFVACKVDDTIKKSRDILAAAYNIKNPDKPLPPDDKIFESPGKVIIGLERLILETIGFDFRTRYPQKLLVKVVRRLLGRSSAQARAFFAAAYAMCIDMYKSFIPIKRTTFTMVMAVVELTARMRASMPDTPPDLVDSIRRFADGHAAGCRHAICETMLDLLDLYVQHHRSTKVGALFDLNSFIDIKIQLNMELDDAAAPRYLFHCSRCEVAEANPLTPISATPPAAAAGSSPGRGTAWPPDATVRRTARGQDGTMRFVFEPESAKKEQETVGSYFREEFDEVEVEVEEPMPPPLERDGAGNGGGGGVGGGGRGGYRGSHRERGDHRWSGPYGGYRGDRSYRGRGRYH